MKNKLPKNWVETDLDTVILRMTNGSSLKQEEESFEGSLPISRIETIWNETIDLDRVKYVDASEDDIKKYGLQKGDVLFSHINSDKHLGKTAVFNLDETIIHGINLLLLRAMPQFDGDLLNYILRHYRFSGKFIEVAQRSVNQSSINQKKLKLFVVPLPPLAEQQRIVAKLDELFGHLDSLKTRLNNIPQILKNFRQAVLTQAVTGKLTGNWRVGKELEDVDLYLDEIYKNRINYQLSVEQQYSDKGLKAPRKPSQSILDGSHIPISIPKLWKEVRLGDLIVDLTDYHANGSYVKLKANVTLKEEEDYACMIRSTNFEKNNFEDLLIYIDEKAYNFMHRSKLFGGEILISKIGNAGSVYLMPNLNRPASLAMNLFALRVNELVDNKFLYYYLISNSGSNLINKYVRGVATKSIDKISVRSVMVGLPSVEEQSEIVKHVEHLFAKADKIETQYQNLKTKIDSLPQAILAKAFKGELVEQLDTDGSAEVLLAEIQKLKEALLSHKPSLRGTKQSVKRKKKVK
jgi:type I restriction enzyme S subunit